MNVCTFEGRLGATPELRTLPSGDAIVTFRLIVERDRKPGVDTIDFRVASPALRRRALTLAPGSVLHVEGCLERRFFRGVRGLESRYEVAATGIRRLRSVDVA